MTSVWSRPSPRNAVVAPLPITFSRMGHLWEAPSYTYDVLRFADVAGRGGVSKNTVRSHRSPSGCSPDATVPVSPSTMLAAPRSAAVLSASWVLLRLGQGGASVN